MSPYEATVVATYGSWQIVEGLTGRALRRRRLGPAKPHLLLGGAAIAFGVWMNLNAKLPDESAAVVIGFGALVMFLGARFSSRVAKELRFGSTELTWAPPGEITGTRWPYTELSHVELFEPLAGLSPAMARRIKPRYQVSIKTKAGGDVPVEVTLFDRQTASELADRIAAATGLQVQLNAGKPD